MHAIMLIMCYTLWWKKTIIILIILYLIGNKNTKVGSTNSRFNHFCPFYHVCVRCGQYFWDVVTLIIMPSISHFNSFVSPTRGG